jgi:hypothetical protein
MGKLRLNKAALAMASAMISSELGGMPLSKALRSVGSTLFLKFGKLSKSLGQRAEGGNVDREYYEWELLVELSRWSIIQDHVVAAQEESDADTIEFALTKLEGQHLRAFKLDSSGLIEMSLDGAMQVRISPDDGASIHSSLSQWILFRKDVWLIARDAEHAMVFEQIDSQKSNSV